MTDDQINIATAEACGWRFNWNGQEDKMTHAKRCSWTRPNGWKLEILPDYCHDLNAAHEAAARLSGKGVSSDHRKVEGGSTKRKPTICIGYG